AASTGAPAGASGPAVPSSFNFPLFASSADSVNGNCDAAEKFLTSMLTFSIAKGLADEFVLPIISFPFVTFSSATENPTKPPLRDELAGFRAPLSEELSCLGAILPKL